MFTFGLRARIATTVICVTLVATVLMGLVAYYLQSTATKERFVAAAKANMMSDTQQAVSYFGVTGPERSVALETYMMGRTGVEWTVFDFRYPLTDDTDTSSAPTGIPRASGGHYDGEVPNSIVEQARQGNLSHRIGYSSDGVRWLLLAGKVADDLVLVQFYNLRKLDAELTDLQQQLAGIALAVAAVAVLVAVLVAGRLQRPIRDAAAAARLLGDGELQTRLSARGKDELADLATSFNSMATRLGESIDELRAKDEQQRRFVADVAHDLRTPVAAMIAAVDSLDSQDETARGRSAALLGLQARRLGRLVEDLLEMSRFDAGAAELRPERCDLRELVADAIALSSDSAVVDTEFVGDALVTADPRRLHLVVYNLLTNAVRHGAEPIAVRVDGTEPERVTLRVSDGGQGIPSELMATVFERFTRGDRSRAATEGSGLGLAIASENARLHGGELTVSNSDGAVFTLRLPRHVAQASDEAHISGAS